MLLVLEAQPGSSVRRALVGALWGRFVPINMRQCVPIVHCYRCARLLNWSHRCAPRAKPAAATALPTDRITLRFHTPLRLIEAKQLVRCFALRTFFQRLIERLNELGRAYGDGPIMPDFRPLVAHAATVRVVDDATRWVDVVSASARQQGRTPIGGLVGEVTLAGDLTPLRELLVWGSLIHVGKNAVKGDGWYSCV